MTDYPSDSSGEPIVLPRGRSHHTMRGDSIGWFAWNDAEVVTPGGTSSEGDRRLSCPGVGEVNRGNPGKPGTPENSGARGLPGDRGSRPLRGPGTSTWTMLSCAGAPFGPRPLSSPVLCRGRCKMSWPTRPRRRWPTGPAGLHQRLSRQQCGVTRAETGGAPAARRPSMTDLHTIGRIIIGEVW